jgi:hypothetical protein
LLKAIVFTILLPVALVAVLCTAISLRLTPPGMWRIGPVIGLNWDGGAKARFQTRFGSVTIGYVSGNWLLERGLISGDGLTLACSYINLGPFIFNYCRPHISSINV